MQGRKWNKSLGWGGLGGKPGIGDDLVKGERYKTFEQERGQDWKS